MSLSEFEVRRIECAAAIFLGKRRPPPLLRDKVDMDFRIDGNSVILFELRCVWDVPSKKIESPIAKATWVNKTREWRVYWQRSDLKWHSYDPERAVQSIEVFFDIVDRDENYCFFG